MFCGALLEQLIKERELTAYRLSKIIGCSQSSIANWISGKNTPNYQKISALADALDVSVDYLLGNEEKPTAKSDELETDELFAFYGDVKKNLTQADKDDIMALIRIRAELNKNKKG